MITYVVINAPTLHGRLPTIKRALHVVMQRYF
jgi:hypothetical protein